MKIIKLLTRFLLVAFSIVFLLISCKNKDTDEVKRLVSEIDGKEYFELLDGPMNIDKAILLIDLEDYNDISDSILIVMAANLLIEDSLKRDVIFNSLNKVYFIFPKKADAFLETMLFSKLLKYPLETLKQIQDKDHFEYDFWINKMQFGYQNQLNIEGITKISILNLMYINCIQCEAGTIEDLTNFIEFLELPL